MPTDYVRSVHSCFNLLLPISVRLPLRGRESVVIHEWSLFGDIRNPTAQNISPHQTFRFRGLPCVPCVENRDVSKSMMPINSVMIAISSIKTISYQRSVVLVGVLDRESHIGATSPQGALIVTSQLHPVTGVGNARWEFEVTERDTAFVRPVGIDKRINFSSAPQRKNRDFLLSRQQKINPS